MITVTVTRGLAEHLVDIHSETLAAAWFGAGQESERSYPRLRTPQSGFVVFGVHLENATREE